MTIHLRLHTVGVMLWFGTQALYVHDLSWINLISFWKKKSICPFSLSLLYCCSPLINSSCFIRISFPGNKFRWMQHFVLGGYQWSDWSCCPFSERANSFLWRGMGMEQWVHDLSIYWLAPDMMYAGYLVWRWVSWQWNFISYSASGKWIPVLPFLFLISNDCYDIWFN